MPKIFQYKDFDFYQFVKVYKKHSIWNLSRRDDGKGDRCVVCVGSDRTRAALENKLHRTFFRFNVETEIDEMIAKAERMSELERARDTGEISFDTYMERWRREVGLEGESYFRRMRLGY